MYYYMRECDIVRVNVIVKTYVMCNLFVLSHAVHVVLEYSYHCSFAIYVSCECSHVTC